MRSERFQLESTPLFSQELEQALAGTGTSAILSAMQSLRTTVDALEKRVSGARWPLPKYRDMLFLY